MDAQSDFTFLGAPLLDVNANGNVVVTHSLAKYLIKKVQFNGVIVQPVLSSPQISHDVTLCG